MRIALIVEGPSDKLFFDMQKAWFLSNSIDTIVRESGGKPNIYKQANNHFTSCIKIEQVDHVIFIVDLDKSSEEEIIKKFRIQGDSTKYSIHITKKELEAWLLADGTGLSCCLDNPYQPAGFTDEINDPKDVLKEKFRKKMGYRPTETELVRSTCSHFSLDRAAHNNKSALRFIQRLRVLVNDSSF